MIGMRLMQIMAKTNVMVLGNRRNKKERKRTIKELRKVGQTPLMSLITDNPLQIQRANVRINAASSQRRNDRESLLNNIGFVRTGATVPLIS